MHIQNHLEKLSKMFAPKSKMLHVCSRTFAQRINILKIDIRIRNPTSLGFQPFDRLEALLIHYNSVDIASIQKTQINLPLLVTGLFKLRSQGSVFGVNAIFVALPV